MSIYILYSADYELHLGGNYFDEREVLINPTYDLLKICDNMKIPLTLFADTLSIIRYKEQNLFTFPESAEKQMIYAIQRGHDIQSHVHPHWDYTVIENNKYKINLDYFLLGNLDTDKNQLYNKILKLLKTSKIFLNDLLKKVDVDYNCIAFRCGGFGLQPNSDIIIKALIDAGYIIDSSIIPHYVLKSNVNNIDFSNVPKMANYYLNNDLDHPSGNNQGIFEIPLPSCKLNFRDTFKQKIRGFSNLINNKINMKLNDSNNNSKGYSIQHIEKKSRLSNYRYFIKNSLNRFYYLDCMTDEKIMFNITKQYLTQFDNTNNDIFFSFLMHPKDMIEEHYIALRKYNDLLKRYYGENIEAISFQQAAKIILKK